MTSEWSTRFAWLIVGGAGLALAPLVLALVREVGKVVGLLRKDREGTE